MIIVSTIKQSKTDPLRKGAYIYLAVTNQQVCPVQAIARYLTRKKEALFITSDGSMLTRDMFASALTKICTNCNWMQDSTTHTASSLVLQHLLIKQAYLTITSRPKSRWRGDAYQRYIRISPASLASILLLLISKINSYI